MKAKRPPGPRGNPITGVAGAVRRDPTGFFEKLREYHPLASVRIGPFRVCLVNDAGLVGEILKDEQNIMRKSWGLRQLGVMFGRGLPTDEGEHWRNARRHIKPMFRRERMQAYAEIMREEALAQVGAWRDGETRDVHPDISRLALRIAARCFFGTQLDERSIAAIGGALTEAMDAFTSVMERGIMLPLRWPLPRNRPLHRAVRRLRAEVEAIVAARRDAPGDDLLGEMLSLAGDPESGFTESDARDNLMAFLIAGHETTALAITWSLYCLGRNPEAERKLHAELDAALAPGEAPGYDGLNRLEWTRQVVQEAMRLYPPSWGISRENRKPFTLGGYRIRRRSQIMMMQSYLHHDARYFEQPEEFRPERFDKELSACARQAYFPFGGGSRVCIGAGFAMTEAVLALATLARHWRFIPAPGPEIELQIAITLRPRHGMPMKLERRQ
ncbi:MAG: cytochrome P450 [Gammaproteobacteria bacterium]